MRQTPRRKGDKRAKNGQKKRNEIWSDWIGRKNRDRTKDTPEVTVCISHTEREPRQDWKGIEKRWAEGRSNSAGRIGDCTLSKQAETGSGSQQQQQQQKPGKWMVGIWKCCSEGVVKVAAKAGKSLLEYSTGTRLASDISHTIICN